jgi:hypothetical protein
MKTQKKKLGNVGMRLKPNEPNLLENYSKYRSRKPRKKKKKKKPKKSIKQIKVLPKVDPFQRIVDDADKKVKEEITVEEKEEPKKEAPSQETRKIVVQKGPQDLSDTDPGVKNLMITASLEPDKKKKGTTIQI